MATSKVSPEALKLESCRTGGEGDAPIQAKTLQVPAQCGSMSAVQPPPTTADSVPKVISTGPQSASSTGTVPGPQSASSTGTVPGPQSASSTGTVPGPQSASSTGTVPGPQSASSTGTVPGPQTSSPSVLVVAAKVGAPGGVSVNGQPQLTKPALSSVNQTAAAAPGRTVVITVPRAPQPVAVAPQLPHAAPTQLPANIQIPPGMMLIRSDSGQLMLVSQQALAQAQQGPRGPRILAPQVSTAVNKRNEKVTVIRMVAPPSFQPASVQKTSVVKVIGVAPKPAAVQTLSAASQRGGQPRVQAVVTESKKEPAVTFSKETLESVKKCKNFLVTLIKLASSDSKSANMANNVRGLVRSLLEGKLEAEEFTEQLYQELKSTPQPCLVPFLKKSLPAVRRLTADPQLFIQQASTSSRNPNTLSSTMKTSSTDTGQTFSTSQQVFQQPRGVTLRPGLATLAHSRNDISKSSRPAPRHTAVQSGKHFTGMCTMKQPFTQDPTRSAKFGFKDSSGSYKEDDDINDVASMAGVNLREENAQSLTTMVGSVVQSCQDQLFLTPSPVLSRILHTGQALGVTEVGPEVVALVSHATQEYLRGMLEKLTVMAEHRKTTLKEDVWHAQLTDVRSQLRFLEEVESLKKKRKDEEERERLLRLARSRSHTEDPLHQQLKQRAKELQQIEEAQLQQREANLTALAAIGPRKKRPLELTEGQVTLLPRQGVQRVTRVMLRDLLMCMEQDHFLRHSLTLYKAMI